MKMTSKQLAKLQRAWESNSHQCEIKVDPRMDDWLDVTVTGSRSMELLSACGLVKPVYRSSNGITAWILADGTVDYSCFDNNAELSVLCDELVIMIDAARKVLGR